jgi:F-type H+-transporting ATPase subunit b
MQLVTPGLGLLFWTFVAFIGVFFILRKYAFGPIAQALKERETSIDNALKAAAKAKIEMEALTANNQKLLDEARSERDAILKKAKESAEKLVEDAKSKAGEEGKRMIEDARQAIRQEQQAAIENIKKQVAELSVEIAEKILKTKLQDNASQKEYVNELLKQTNLN